MANKNVTLKDANNNNLFPKTLVSNVFDENNVSLDHLISGLPLGMILPSAVVQNDGGLHLLDGEQLSKTGIYTQFCTWLTAKYNADPTSVKTCTEAEWQAEVGATGQCGKFVITSTTVRLPKITQFIEGLNSLSDLAKRVDAGLPNIQGSSIWGINNGTPTGAFIDQGSGSYGTGSGSGARSLGFDASVSNSIYGNSTTVQPQSIRYPYYIVVATIVKTQIQVDLDQYISDLNLKADKTSVQASCRTWCTTGGETVAVTGGTKNLNSTTVSLKRGKYICICQAPMKTSTKTANIELVVNGTQITGSTNITSFITVIGTGELDIPADGNYTVTFRLQASSGATATIQSYSYYGFVLFKIGDI